MVGDVLSRAFGELVADLLDSGLQVRFRAAGRSMAPAVRDGDVLTVAPVAPELVAVGDVILCDTWRGPIAHRVVAMAGAGPARRFVLRGDCSLENDRPVEPARVRGRLVAVERDGCVDRHSFARGALTRRLRGAQARWQRALLRMRLAAAVALGLV
ncbi:MAG TPA: hypothetical protein VHM31_20215 [Polyangia bacterium]|nr:hypothetical protein [Polyangia bacterium]